MKILMIGPFPGQISGMTIANEMLYNEMKEKGHEVEFVNSDTNKEFKDLNTQGKFNLRKIFDSLKPIIKGINKILFGKFDYVYITPAQSYLGFMKYTPFINIAKFIKKPCYLHIHGGFIRIMYDSVGDKKKKKLIKYFNKVNGIIVLGDSLKCMFSGLIPEEKILVCENGVQKEFQFEQEEIYHKIESFSSEDTFRVLYLSNLMKTKGILELLEAAKILKEDGFKFHLDLAGAIEDDIKGEVEKAINEMSGYIKYHGLVKGNYKKELLYTNHVFCLPTYYPNEGQPISILEAMMSGEAIITTNQGGIGDIFKNKENGIQCVANSESISASIKDVKENYAEFAKFNYKEGIDKYTSSAFACRILNLISTKK